MYNRRAIVHSVEEVWRELARAEHGISATLGGSITDKNKLKELYAKQGLLCNIFPELHSLDVWFDTRWNAKWNNKAFSCLTLDETMKMVLVWLNLWI